MSIVNNMDRTRNPGDDAFLGSATRPQKGDYAENSVGADNDSGLLDEGQPFHTTHVGKIPPEIREKIFINLLALPPPFAGRNIARQDTGTSHELAVNGDNNFSNTSCYHLKNSWLKILQTCRQIYLEAFPVFYGRKSYYAASAEELVSLFRLGHPGEHPALCHFVETESRRSASTMSFGTRLAEAGVLLRATVQ